MRYVAIHGPPGQAHFLTLYGIVTYRAHTIVVWGLPVDDDIAISNLG